MSPPCRIILTRLQYLLLNHEYHFFQFEIIMNVLVRFFRFILTPMLWGKHNKYLNSFNFRRQNLTSIDVIF